MTHCDVWFESEEDKVRFVSESELQFRAGLNEAADRIFMAHPPVVTLSGPTCSGKTTTANTLIRLLTGKGWRVRAVSLDNFYLCREELEENARRKGVAYDWDSFSSIDARALSAFISDVLAKRTARCPVYDFLTKERSGYEAFDPNEYDVVLFEGIQAVYPQVAAMFGEERVCSVFISVCDGITVCGSEFSPRELRFLRRLVRDARFRGTLPEKTFAIWETVLENEISSIEPYAAYAEIRIDSLLQYEPFVIAGEALPLLSGITPESGYYADAQRLIGKLKKVPPLDPRFVPEDSVFREFIGR